MTVLQLLMKFIFTLLNPSFITVFPTQNASLDLILSQFNNVHKATRYLLYLIHCCMDAVSSPSCTVGIPKGEMTGNVTVIVASFVAEIRPRAGQTAVRTMAEARHFSLPQNVQTGSGTHHTFHSTSPGVLSQGKNGRGYRGNWQLTSIRAEVKKGKAIRLLIKILFRKKLRAD
jgi:hypothetical protein